MDLTDKRASTYISCANGRHLHENPGSLRLQYEGASPTDTCSGKALVVPSWGCSESWSGHSRHWRHQQPCAPAVGAPVGSDRCATHARPEGKFIASPQRTHGRVCLARRLCGNQRQSLTSGRCQTVYRATGETSRQADLRRRVHRIAGQIRSATFGGVHAWVVSPLCGWRLFHYWSGGSRPRLTPSRRFAAEVIALGILFNRPVFHWSLVTASDAGGGAVSGKNHGRETMSQPRTHFRGGRNYQSSVGSAAQRRHEFRRGRKPALRVVKNVSRRAAAPVATQSLLPGSQVSPSFGEAWDRKRSIAGPAGGNN